jgi:drug/metabolite transporter (DMT)-like permease
VTASRNFWGWSSGYRVEADPRPDLPQLPQVGNYALRAIAVVSFLSLVVILPGYLAWYGLEHLRARPPFPMAMQALVQGLMQGVVALTAYSQAIRVLGVSRAVLFPAMVPAVSILVGIPIVGEVPNATQITGLLLVTIGLMSAIGALRWIAVLRKL